MKYIFQIVLHYKTTIIQKFLLIWYKVLLSVYIFFK